MVKFFQSRIFKIILALVVIAMLLLMALMSSFAFANGVYAETETETNLGENDENIVTFLFTHDMHSHLEKFPKIKTIYDYELLRQDETFLVDAGDFAMGTPYQTIYSTHAPELIMMGEVGFDVTVLGNHEFDYRSRGLSEMLNTARVSGERLPEIVISNIDWDKTLADPELEEDAKVLKQAVDDIGIADYTVVQKGNVSVAFFGILGKQADDYAPESGTEFKNQIESAREVVQEIKRDENVDFIVCLSHSGTFEDPSESEDEILAKEVDGIDLIVSGHTHTYMNEPIKINSTYVVSCGQYNDNIGKITLSKENSESASLVKYELIPLDDSIEDNVEVTNRIHEFREIVDETYFAEYGYEWEQVISRNDIAFPGIDSFGDDSTEEPLGNLISDSYIYAVAEVEGDNYEPVTVAIAPHGVIRGSFNVGDITVADAFNVLSLGIGMDRHAGYPLASVYLTGKEIKLIPEIDASIGEIMKEAQLYCSGISYTYNPNRMFLNKAYDINIDDDNKVILSSVNDEMFHEPIDGHRYSSIDDQKLYRVVANLYSAQMLSMVTDLSGGLLKIEPKDSEGNVIQDFEAHIIHDKYGKELKDWYALAFYVDSFENDEIPLYYADERGRKIFVDSTGIWDLVKSSNKYFFMMIGIVPVGVLLIISIAYFVIMRIKKRTFKNNNAKE